MATNRKHLPQLDGRVFLTDAGIETTLIFQDGADLPHFAAFHLLRNEDGTCLLRNYFVRHASIARAAGAGFILESATWRASADWGTKLGYSAAALEIANRQAIDLLHDVRREIETAQSPMVISGCVGPSGDGYNPGAMMTVDEAQAYHTAQVRVLADAGADLVTAITMTNVNEAIGVTRAAQDVGLPVVIAYTVETDGHLPTGDPLGEAIQAVDEATGDGPAYFMLNCAHPTHFAEVLAKGGTWVPRLRGLRANASRRSHAELDEAPDLDAGDPLELAGQYRDLHARFSHITVLGGCCGTDHRHIEQIAQACVPA